ncbi:hypothetical protein HLY00_238 [Mycolicibacterium hippocampi]|uniref:Uncharacterized protein n=1 Tax=Mycolicibacterium hippocampi TaxID=659824 RepID=A0A850PF28_9MYCO|nr:hypothetical protein [Mycolicibacterium hippocampi]
MANELSQDDWSAKVDCQRTVDLVHRVIRQLARRGNSRVGNEYVQRTDLGEQLVKPALFAQIGHDRSASDPCAEFIQNFGIPTGERQLRPAFGKGLRERATDAA